MAIYGRRITVGERTWIEEEYPIGGYGRKGKKVTVSRDSMGNIIVIEDDFCDFSKAGGDISHNIKQHAFPPETDVEISDLTSDEYFRLRPRVGRSASRRFLVEVILGIILLVVFYLLIIFCEPVRKVFFD